LKFKEKWGIQNWFELSIPKGGVTPMVVNYINNGIIIGQLLKIGQSLNIYMIFYAT